MKYVQCFITLGLAIVLLLSIVALGGCCSTKNNVNLTPKAKVDLTRYLGQWYEIARFDHWFERGMTHTKAIYTMFEDGSIRVVNTGLNEGKEKTSTGKAKLTNHQGLLRVSFFWPFYADYRILWIDDDYQYVLVGGSSADYLWILSRTSTIDVSVKNAILAEARKRGYDTDKLIWVEQ
jgi:lipocalin